MEKYRISLACKKYYTSSFNSSFMLMNNQCPVGQQSEGWMGVFRNYIIKNKIY